MFINYPPSPLPFHNCCSSGIGLHLTDCLELLACIARGHSLSPSSPTTSQCFPFEAPFLPEISSLAVARSIIACVGNPSLIPGGRRLCRHGNMWTTRTRRQTRVKKAYLSSHSRRRCEGEDKGKYIWVGTWDTYGILDGNPSRRLRI